MSYEGPIQAPIAQGEEIAELVIAVDGMPDYRVPLVAGQDVGEAGLVRRALNGVLGWFS